MTLIQAVYAHWAIRDVNAAHQPESVDIHPRVQKVYDAKLREFKKSHTKYCNTVRVARAGVLV
jgi:hypothetical protein